MGLMTGDGRLREYRGARVGKRAGAVGVRLAAGFLASQRALCAITVTALATTRKRPHGRQSESMQAAPTVVAADPGLVLPGRVPSSSASCPSRARRVTWFAGRRCSGT
jgi:hypothetical protein